MVPTSSHPSYDRTLALHEFDASKSGVKGLVDAGITSLPPFFIHSNLSLSLSSFPSTPKPRVTIPTVDLSLPRSETVHLIRSAAKSFGFFHVINHPIPIPLLHRSISAVRSFYELPLETRSQFYSRQSQGGVSYASNFDLFRSAAASWRDTIQIGFGRVRADPERIPPACREEVLELEAHVLEAGKVVMGLLAEGLGVEEGRLEGMTCHEGRVMVCHYYPWCPEPDRTMGLGGHTDPGVVTVVVQDNVGGLQVKWEREDGEWEWVDVEPVPGALVINIGDLLQIISNNEYKSVEHRVLANSHKEARVSIGVFFNPGKRGDTDFYGPLPEIVSPEKPAIYRNFTMTEYLTTFFKKELGSRCLVDYFKL